MDKFNGIQEQKKGRKKPLGMVVLFISLIIIGLIYIFLFSPKTTGWNQAYQEERRTEAQKSTVITHEAAEVASGKVETKVMDGPGIYQANCAICHGEKLEGGIGPKLTGPNYLYGNALADNIRVITDGTTNGMPGFRKQLGPEMIHAVARYIQSYHTQ